MEVTALDFLLDRPCVCVYVWGRSSLPPPWYISLSVAISSRTSTDLSLNLPPPAVPYLISANLLALALTLQKKAIYNFCSALIFLEARPDFLVLLFPTEEK